VDKENLKPIELQARFAKGGLQKLLKKTIDDVSESNGTVAAGGVEEEAELPLVLYAAQLKEFRDCLIDLAMPRLNATFRFRAKVCIKGYPECVTMEDFLMEYRTGVYDNNKRYMVHVLCHLMWGKECFGGIEKKIMDRLKIKYNGMLVSGLSPKCRRKGGSIRKMIVRLKQSKIVDRFRYAWKTNQIA
jgi:hypothetical protein